MLIKRFCVIFMIISSIAAPNALAKQSKYMPCNLQAKENKRMLRKLLVGSIIEDNVTINGKIYISNDIDILDLLHVSA